MLMNILFYFITKKQTIKALIRKEEKQMAKYENEGYCPCQVVDLTSDNRLALV